MLSSRPRDLVSNNQESNWSDGKEVMSILSMASEVSELCCSSGCCRDLGSNERERTLADKKTAEGKGSTLRT